MEENASIYVSLTSKHDLSTGHRIMVKNGSHLWGVNAYWERVQESFGVVKKLCLGPEVVVWVYTHVNIHQAVPMRFIHFDLCVPQFFKNLNSLGAGWQKRTNRHSLAWKGTTLFAKQSLSVLFLRISLLV